MNDVMERKAVSNHQILDALMKEVVSGTTPKSLRLAYMALLVSAIQHGKTDVSQAQRRLINSGLQPEEAIAILPVANKLLIQAGIIVEGAISKDVLEILEPQLLLEAGRRQRFSTSAFEWKGPVHSDRQMLKEKNLSPAILKALAPEQMPEVYQAINGMQKIGFIRNRCLEQIPNWKDGLEDYQLAYLEQYKGSQNDRMYFYQSLDFRGRMYYRGIVNPSNMGDFGKAYFKFTTSKVLGEDGLKALRLHVANLAGVKGSISSRVQWSTENAIDLWNRVQGQTIEVIQSESGEKKIFQLYAALNEYQRVMKQGGIKAKSSLIIKQDGSCNGIQHSSAILRNAQAAKSVNIRSASEDDSPEDIYQEYADALKKVLPIK